MTPTDPSWLFQLFISMMMTGFMIVDTLAICTIHITELPQVHAFRHYGLNPRFEELLSAFHNANSLRHYNPNSLKLVSLTSHSKKHALQGVPTFGYLQWLAFENVIVHHDQT